MSICSFATLNNQTDKSRTNIRMSICSFTTLNNQTSVVDKLEPKFECQFALLRLSFRHDVEMQVLCFSNESQRFFSFFKRVMLNYSIFWKKAERLIGTCCLKTEYTIHHKFTNLSRKLKCWCSHEILISGWRVVVTKGFWMNTPILQKA